jgi:hypothetical protein
MVGKIPREVPNDRADKVIVKMFGFRVGAYYRVDPRCEFILVQFSCTTSAEAR